MEKLLRGKKNNQWESKKEEKVKEAIIGTEIKLGNKKRWMVV